MKFVINVYFNYQKDLKDVEKLKILVLIQEKISFRN